METTRWRNRFKPPPRVPIHRLPSRSSARLRMAGLDASTRSTVLLRQRNKPAETVPTQTDPARSSNKTVGSKLDRSCPSPTIILPSSTGSPPSSYFKICCPAQINIPPERAAAMRTTGDAKFSSTVNCPLRKTPTRLPFANHKVPSRSVVSQQVTPPLGKPSLAVKTVALPSGELRRTLPEE